MPKTRNAFALKGFDSERILQRRFFKGLNLPETTDERILERLSMKDSDSFEETQAKMAAIGNLLSKVAEYQKHIKRHGDRLTRYARAVEHTITTDEKADIAALKLRYSRAGKLSVKYSGSFTAYGLTSTFLGGIAVDDVGGLCNKLAARYKELDAKIKAHYRKIFATRLKQARKEMGLTQTELSTQLGLSQRGVSNLENAIHEPSLSTLVKISEKSNRPVGWFLGAS